MTSSPPSSGGELVLRSDEESQLSSLVSDLSQNVQTMMDNMLAMIKEIDQNSAGIMKEIENSKDSVYQRKNTLEQEKNFCTKLPFQFLACSVVEISAESMRFSFCLHNSKVSYSRISIQAYGLESTSLKLNHIIWYFFPFYIVFSSNQLLVN